LKDPKSNLTAESAEHAEKTQDLFTTTDTGSIAGFGQRGNEKRRTSERRKKPSQPKREAYIGR